MAKTSYIEVIQIPNAILTPNKIPMLNSETFDFLKDLAVNNNRDWFNTNKSRHDLAKENVIDFASAVITRLSKIDPSIPSGLDPKSCIMRIYRDIRFSKNKTPYKTNFGMAFSDQGKNFKDAGYYLNIQPGKSFIAGGCWMPESPMLKAIRQEIDYNGIAFHAIINNTPFKNYFGSPDTEHKLKTLPKGYSFDHPDIEYLKLKSFTFSRPLISLELSHENALEEVINGFAILSPFIAFLKGAVN